MKVVSSTRPRVQRCNANCRGAALSRLAGVFHSVMQTVQHTTHGLDGEPVREATRDALLTGAYYRVSWRALRIWRVVCVECEH